MELFDTHVHLDAHEFDADRREVIERAQAAGVTRFVTIGAGYGPQSASRAIALADEYPFIWASAGVHPHDAETPLDIGQVRKLAAHPKVVAIGETGLDFYRDYAPRERQYAWFEAQIELAKELKKPLIIHSRAAGNECFELLSQRGASAVGGVFHCFSEDAAFAKRLREINFIISIPGSVTFKNAAVLQVAVKHTALEHMLLETDAPYLAPVPHRGKRCETAFMLETARKIAEIKGLALEEVARQTTANALNFFGIR